MLRIFLFIILFTIVFSWEETRDAISRIFGGKPRDREFFTDRFVGTALLMFALPVSLLAYMQTAPSLKTAALILAIELSAVSLLVFGHHRLTSRFSMVEKYHGIEKFSAVMFAVAGMFLPTAWLVWGHPQSERRLIGKYSVMLSLGAAIVYLFNLLIPQESLQEDWLPAFTTLNIVLFGSIAILVATEFLKKYFRMRQFGLAPYLRVVLGMGIITILFMNLA